MPLVMSTNLLLYTREGFRAFVNGPRNVYRIVMFARAVPLAPRES